jgi:hypothetical protein
MMGVMMEFLLSWFGVGLISGLLFALISSKFGSEKVSVGFLIIMIICGYISMFAPTVVICFMLIEYITESEFESDKVKKIKKFFSKELF